MTVALTADPNGKPIGVPGVPRPSEPAHIIKDDAEAVAVAERLASQ